MTERADSARQFETTGCLIASSATFGGQQEKTRRRLSPSVDSERSRKRQKERGELAARQPRNGSVLNTSATPHTHLAQHGNPSIKKDSTRGSKIPTVAPVMHRVRFDSNISLMPIVQDYS